jgi:hypothetical protein
MNPSLQTLDPRTHCFPCMLDMQQTLSQLSSCCPPRIRRQSMQDLDGMSMNATGLPCRHSRGHRDISASKVSSAKLRGPIPMTTEERRRRLEAISISPFLVRSDEPSTIEIREMLRRKVKSRKHQREEVSTAWKARQPGRDQPFHHAAPGNPH